LLLALSISPGWASREARSFMSPTIGAGRSAGAATSSGCGDAVSDSSAATGARRAAWVGVLPRVDAPLARGLGAGRPGIVRGVGGWSGWMKEKERGDVASPTPRDLFFFFKLHGPARFRSSHVPLIARCCASQISGSNVTCWSTALDDSNSRPHCNVKASTPQVFCCDFCLHVPSMPQIVQKLMGSKYAYRCCSP
jgi:hypothetical protein